MYLKQTDLQMFYILDIIDVSFRSRVLCKIRKEQRERKASEENTTGELSKKLNELRSEMDEMKSEMSQMRGELVISRGELGAKIDAITNILSAFVKPAE